jgi:hypothetical protein
MIALERHTLTGFAACVELAECSWSMHECVDIDELPFIHCVIAMLAMWICVTSIFRIYMNRRVHAWVT